LFVTLERSSTPPTGHRRCNRALPDEQPDDYVDALATRIASFDAWAIANTKRLVGNATLPPEIEIRAGWDTYLASSRRPAA
jgi:hypothetical protein